MTAMSSILVDLFGTENHITVAQECARAVLIFVFGLTMLRLSGRRTFAEWSALDVIITVTAGSALGRVMTGSGSLPGTLAAVVILVLLHLGLSHLVARSLSISTLIEGDAISIVRDGVLDEAARRRHKISSADLAAAIRGKNIGDLEDLAKIKIITLEPSGEITVVTK
jgi:uncharacterized membrane protein YcaP (DUF421 family)